MKISRSSVLIGFVSLFGCEASVAPAEAPKSVAPASPDAAARSVVEGYLHAEQDKADRTAFFCAPEVVPRALVGLTGWSIKGDVVAEEVSGGALPSWYRFDTVLTLSDEKGQHQKERSYFVTRRLGRLKIAMNCDQGDCELLPQIHAIALQNLPPEVRDRCAFPSPLSN